MLFLKMKDCGYGAPQPKNAQPNYPIILGFPWDNSVDK